MATADALLSDPELLASGWNLDPIVDGEGGAGVERLLDQALERGAKFAETYTGKLASLDGSGLREAISSYASPASIARARRSASARAISGASLESEWPRFASRGIGGSSRPARIASSKSVARRFMKDG